MLHVPAEIWRLCLDRLAFHELVSPVASTSKLFFAIADRRLKSSPACARALRLSSTLRLGPSYCMPRIDRQTGHLLFIAKRLAVGTGQYNHCFEVWSLESAKVEASFYLPRPFRNLELEDSLCSPDGEHVCLSFYKFILLLRYNRVSKQVTMVRGYDLGNDDHLKHSLEENEDFEAEMSTVRFSGDGRYLSIAYFHAPLDFDGAISILVARVDIHETLRDKREEQKESPFDASLGEDDTFPIIRPQNARLSSFKFPADYNWDLLILHGAQVNPQPLQILIPPNRISDAGFVIGNFKEDGGGENGTVLKVIKGFFEHQILGFSPDCHTLLEMRETCSITQALFHSTGGEDGHHGSRYNRDGKGSGSRKVEVSAELLSVQFSSDSSVLFLLHGWTHGTVIGASWMTGWTVIRRCDRKVAIKVDLTGGQDRSCLLEGREFGINVISISARTSYDGALLYVRSGIDGYWNAYEVVSGSVVWKGEDSTETWPSRFDEEESGEWSDNYGWNGLGDDADDNVSEVSFRREELVVGENEGFVNVRAKGAGHWEFQLYQ